MAHVARKAGLSRESLYKALGENGNPSFATVLKVARALGVRLHAEVAPSRRQRAPRQPGKRELRSIEL